MNLLLESFQMFINQESKTAVDMHFYGSLNSFVSIKVNKY